jgi:hypothetical protein
MLCTCHSGRLELLGTVQGMEAAKAQQIKRHARRRHCWLGREARLSTPAGKALIDAEVWRACGWEVADMLPQTIKHWYNTTPYLGRGRGFIYLS